MSVLKRNAVYNTLLSLSQILFPLITFPYASRVLGPEAIGAVSFADNFTTYFLIFAALGIPLYGIREIAKVKDDPKKLGAVFSELMLIHLATSLVAVLILGVLSYHTDKLKSNLGLYQIGMSVVLGSVFMAEWFFQGIQKFKYIALRTVLVRLFTIVLLFLFVHSPADKNIYYGLSLLAILISAALNMYAVSKMIKFSFKGLFFKRHLKPLLLIFSNSIITTIYLVFDTIILGFLTNDVNVGYYSASMRISKLSLAVIGVLSAVLLPRLTVAFQNEELDEARSLISKSMNFVILLSVPIAIGTYCLSAEIIRLFAGNSYLPAVGSLQILCFIVIFVGMAQVFSHQILLPMHMEKKILFASMFGVVISLSLNFLLIPIFKHAGAAISSLSTELFVTIALFFFSRKALKFHFPLMQFIQCAVTCSFFFVIKFAVMHITTAPVWVILFTVILSALTYLLAQVFLWKNKEVFNIIAQLKK